MSAWMAGLLLAVAPVAPVAGVPIVGGWSVVAATDPEVRAAADAALVGLQRRHARVARIEAASRQVVAGMNYRLTLRLSDRSRWDVTVWQQLSGQWQVTAKQRLR
ncbi:MAG: hypothetical protein KGN34_14070 [Sphingomonadales bacterium]|nr:hypothetical protein [Sphingomonadales bacterium]